MGSCDAAAVVPCAAAGVTIPEVETCVMVAAGPVLVWAFALAVLLVHPATRIAARQTKTTKTRAVLFDMF
jgi:hypothetical protein